MLATPPATASTRRRAKWLWVALAILAGVIVIFIAAGAILWPFTREQISRALEEASGRKVQIRSIAQSYFPPGCTVEGIRFLSHKQADGTPVMTVDRMIVRTSIFGLFTPRSLALVRVQGLHLRAAADEKADGGPAITLNSGTGSKPLSISRINADGAILEFMRHDRRDPPYVLRVEHLALTDVGSGTAMRYEATLVNTEPPGTIHAQGRFGPWNPSNVAATPVSGTFTYDGIDLSHFQGIRGMGRGRGQFSGPLGRIQARGQVDVTGFGVAGTKHTVNLATTFQAQVNGTNGDVELEPAITRMRHSRIEVRGSIAGRAPDDGKSARFAISTAGRVEDLLYLFTSGEPGLTGDVTARGDFVWPPGPRRFLEKIRLDLNAGLKGSRFTVQDTQDGIDRLSESAQGESRKQEDRDARTVLSNLQGSVRVRDGVAQVSEGLFHAPGADARLHGTYNLLNQKVDLHGTLATTGRLSDTTAGFKKVIVKAITPLFKKRAKARVVPFEITGSYGQSRVSVDWKKSLSP